ncbi:MAG: hypothetical protein H8E35_10060 [Ardenticatenia bacterium]|nr:hypothetical protein [Ardenticatenia bacterium]
MTPTPMPLPPPPPELIPDAMRHTGNGEWDSRLFIVAFLLVVTGGLRLNRDGIPA